MSIIAWITVPLSTSNVFLVKKYPLQLWPVLDVMIQFTGAMALYFYAFGYVLQHRSVRRNLLKQLLMIPEIFIASIFSIVCENVAVLTMWFGSWEHFYIVQKETESDQDTNELSDIKVI